jgi:hypothetical protein
VRRSALFLGIVGTFFLLLFAIPLFLVPFEWAEAFGWEVERTDVGSYFGRCLGAVAIAISGQAVWAARSPERHRPLFDLFAVAAALLAIVHLRGLFEDSQPLIEHLETLGYASFAGLALWAKPPGGAGAAPQPPGAGRRPPGAGRQPPSSAP